MAIIQNKTTENGDVLIIKSEVPIIGLIALIDFLDDTEGESGGKYFDKEFSYSVDGINYTDFQPLTASNLQQININSTDTFYVEYRYKRSGVDNTGELAFNYVELEGEFQFVTTGQPWEDSNFSSYLPYNGVCTVAWSVNVLEKLYKKGILPNYLERGRSGTNEEDKDFMDFWRTVTHYFGWYVCLARYYRYFYNDVELLEEYIIQKGLNVCESSTDVVDLFYLMQNYLNEIRHRGTIQIIKEKGYIYPIAEDSSISESISSSTSVSDLEISRDVKFIDGEYLRLICRNIIDEFCFLLNKKEHVGWNIGNSSPLYKTLNVNKYNINTEYISNFNLFNNGNVTIGNQNGNDTLIISNVANGQVEGVGSFDENHFINVNPFLDYEISFFVKQNVNIDNVTFGVNGYNIDNNKVNLLNTQTFADSNIFFKEKSLNTTTYQKITGVVYGVGNISQYNSSNSYQVNKIVSYLSNYYKALRDVPESILPTNVNYWQILDNSEKERVLKTSGYIGTNLQFKNNIIKILPYIVLDNENNVGGTLELYGISVKPINNYYSKGFINTPNILESWAVNRNLKKSNREVENESIKYLFPYNVTPIFKWLKEPSS